MAFSNGGFLVPGFSSLGVNSVKIGHRRGVELRKHAPGRRFRVACPVPPPTQRSGRTRETPSPRCQVCKRPQGGRPDSAPGLTRSRGERVPCPQPVVPAAAQARRAPSCSPARGSHPTSPPRSGLLAAGCALSRARESRGSPARRVPQSPGQTPRPDARPPPTPHPAVPRAAASWAEGGRLASVSSKKSNSGSAL